MLSYLQLRSALEKKLITITGEEYISLYNLYEMITNGDLEMSLGPNSPPDTNLGPKNSPDIPK